MKILLFIFILFSSCTSTELLLNASSQAWAGGLKGSGNGINYKFKMIAPESKNAFFITDICVDEKLYKGDIHQKTFVKGDTILVSSRKTDEICDQKNMIRYLVNDQLRYLDIDTIERLPKLFYP